MLVDLKKITKIKKTAKDICESEDYSICNTNEFQL